MYGRNLTSDKDRQAYERDEARRIDPRDLKPGDACVVRILTGAGARRFGIEYGGVVTESPDGNTVLLQTERASTKEVFTLPLAVGSDGHILSHPVSPRTTTAIRKGKWDPAMVVEVEPAPPQKVIGHVLPKEFAFKPIEPLTEDTSETAPEPE